MKCPYARLYLVIKNTTLPKKRRGGIVTIIKSRKEYKFKVYQQYEQAEFIGCENDSALLRLEKNILMAEKFEPFNKNIKPIEVQQRALFV